MVRAGTRVRFFAGLAWVGFGLDLDGRVWFGGQADGPAGR